MSNINNFISTASLTGQQYSNVTNAVQTLTNLRLAPVDVAAAAVGVQNVNSGPEQLLQE